MRSVVYLSIAVLLIVGSSISAHAVVEDDGLILYFSFDKEKGGKIEDETGGGHDGEMKDVEIITKEVVHGTGALACEEGTSSVTVDSFKELEDYTDNSYLFWLQFTVKNSGGWDQIIAKKAPGSDRSPGIWTCNRVSLHIHYRFNPGNAGSHCVGPDGEGDEFDTGEWHHIAGIKEGAELKFYIDGKVVDEKAVPKDHVQGAEKLYIGQTGYQSARFYIDDLYVYDRALSEKEILNVMDGGLLPVEPENKLSTTWGQLKARRY